jgi:nucleoside-diphosphate-sugar epimerase
MHLNNDGLSYRNFLPFDDVARAVRMLLASETSGRTLNLAQGRAQRLDEVARLIQHAATGHPALSFGQGCDSFREPFTISTTRLDDLGWRPSANLADEIRRAISFFA